MVCQQTKCKLSIDFKFDKTTNFPIFNATVFPVIDASGVPGTTGLFDGNVHALGSFDACVAVDVVDKKFCGVNIPEFRGRYVLATLMPFATPPSSKNQTGKNFRSASFRV